MSSGWGLLKRKQGDQCRCCCWPAAQLALQTPSHFAAVLSPSPKSLFQCWERPRGVQKNYPTEPNSPSIGFCPLEREREEGEARGLVTCLVGLTEKKVYYSSKVKRTDSIQYISVQTGGSFQGKITHFNLISPLTSISSECACDVEVKLSTNELRFRACKSLHKICSDNIRVWYRQFNLCWGECKNWQKSRIYKWAENKDPVHMSIQ